MQSNLDSTNWNYIFETKALKKIFQYLAIRRTSSYWRSSFNGGGWTDQWWRLRKCTRSALHIHHWRGGKPTKRSGPCSLRIAVRSRAVAFPHQPHQPVGSAEQWSNDPRRNKVSIAALSLNSIHLLYSYLVFISSLFWFVWLPIVAVIDMFVMCCRLLTVAIETSADFIATVPSLFSLIQNEGCRHLFSLLNSERLSLLAASCRLCFLLFEAMRFRLKFQLELYLTKLMEVVVHESPRITFERRLIVLEAIAQLFRIPG